MNRMEFPEFLLDKKAHKNKYYEAIGKISVAFTRLELMLALIIKELLGCNTLRANIVTSGMGTVELISIAESLGKAVLSTGSNKELIGLLKSIDKLRFKRNQVMHSLWIFHDDGADATRMEFKRKGKFNKEFVNITVLNDLNLQICDLSLKVADFSEKIPLQISVLGKLAERIKGQ